MTDLEEGKSFTTYIMAGMKDSIDDKHNFFKDEETIGSSKNADYSLPLDQKLAPIHGRLFKSYDGKFYYQDLVPKPSSWSFIKLGLN